MQFSVAAVLAFASAALAQVNGFDPITKPTQGEKVPAGSTYKLVWEPSAAYPGTVAISLLGGSSPQTLSVVKAIASGVDGSAGSYSWSVDKSLGTLATYGIMITLESNPKVFQYGFPFQITESGSGSGTSSSASSSASGTGSASGTASASVTKTASGSSTTSSAHGVTYSGNYTVPSSTVAPSSSSISSIRSNMTTTSTGGAVLTTITSVTNVVSQRPSTTGSSTGSLATNGVASLAASSFALIGGVAVAVLAL